MKELASILLLHLSTSTDTLTKTQRIFCQTNKPETIVIYAMVSCQLLQLTAQYTYNQICFCIIIVWHVPVLP